MRLFVCLFLVFFVGCQPSVDPKLTPVSGRLTVDGKPLANIAVQLIPKVIGDKKAGVEYAPSVGVTNEDGKFVVRAISGNRGAPPGKYKVVLASQGEGITKSVPTTALTKEERYKQQYESMQKYVEGLKKNEKSRKKEFPFPQEFSKAETTPREIEVTGQSLTLDLDL